MSFLSKVWAAIRTPKSRLVGRDLNGNKFYEKDAIELGRPKRTIVYRNPEDMWDHQKRIPIQWSAWLSHTRPNAPTIKELQIDAERQLRVRHKASLIDAKDREESEAMKRLRAATHAELVGAPDKSAQLFDSELARGQGVQKSSDGSPDRNTPATNPWDAAKNAPETEAWTPQLRRRGP